MDASRLQRLVPRCQTLLLLQASQALPPVFLQVLLLRPVIQLLVWPQPPFARVSQQLQAWFPPRALLPQQLAQAQPGAQERPPQR